MDSIWISHILHPILIGFFFYFHPLTKHVLISSQNLIRNVIKKNHKLNVPLSSWYHEVQLCFIWGTKRAIFLHIWPLRNCQIWVTHQSPSPQVHYSLYAAPNISFVLAHFYPTILFQIFLTLGRLDVADTFSIFFFFHFELKLFSSIKWSSSCKQGKYTASKRS